MGDVLARLPRIAPALAASGGSLRTWINIMTCVVLGLPSVPCRAAPDLTDASCRALCEEAGRWYVDDRHRRWMGQLCQASNLFRFVRGSRRICLLSRSDVVRRLRKSYRAVDRV